MGMGIIKDERPRRNLRGISLSAMFFNRGHARSIDDKIRATIERLKAEDIRGCITGSTLLDEVDFSLWEEKPDIDVFVYAPFELVRVVTLLQSEFGMTPGKGTEQSEKQEEWKLQQLYKRGLSKKIPITTYSFEYDGVVVNATYKEHCHSLVDVLASFDMSIVMKGYDLHQRFELDLRVEPHNVAVPNMLRDQDVTLWNVDKWSRQFNRVVKYYGRGFDTRPMARFYSDMLNEVIESGSVFTTDKGKQVYEDFSKEFVKTKETIDGWLAEHNDD